jgi:hypothetical protein
MAQTKPKAGQFYGVSNNGTDGQFLKTDGTGGMSWDSPITNPTITSIDYPGSATAADPAGGESVIINGTLFASGITCTVGGTSAVTAFNSSTQITITTPAKAAGPYTVAVTNTDGGTVSENNFIQYSGVPVWSTAAGTLGNVLEGTSASFQVTATEGSDTIEYAVTTGTLPTGLSLATATGAITGTAPAVSADTTTTFSITATDDENQTSSERSFSITVQNDAPSNHFNTVLYTGNGSTDRNITGVGFDPDLTIVKSRSGGENWGLGDTVRGGGFLLYPNLTNAQVSSAYITPSAVSDGFKISTGNNNSSGNNYVAWNFKAGGAAVANTDGTINSQVSANTTLGFSIVQYTGTGTNGATVGHGLDSTPDFVIVKNIDTSTNWHVYSSAVMTGGDGKFLRLNTTNSLLTDGGDNVWDPGFNNQTFGIGAANSQTNDSMLAYCFASKPGFSKAGSYTGNGSVNGPIVETGFEPAFVMIKRTDNTGNWWIVDNKRSPSNPRNNRLLANTNNSEVVYTPGNSNFLANGFQLAGTYNSTNASGGTYIYLAFAADPSTTTPSLANSFDAEVWLGNAATRTINYGFKPDLWFAKNYTATNGYGHYWAWFDSIRGGNSVIHSNATNAANTNLSGTGSNAIDFVNNGISINTTGNSGYNESGFNNVGYAFKAGGLSSINTDGSITSLVSANQAAGFSIVQYKGNSTNNATVGTGLTVACDLVIVKDLTSSNYWCVGGSTVGNGENLYLNDTGAKLTRDRIKSVQANTFTLGNHGETNSTNNFISYCFTSIAGYSKVGTYSGTGAAQTITTGFQPGFLMVKATSHTSSWYIVDSARTPNYFLSPNSNAVEYTDSGKITFTSNGFTLGSSSYNNSGYTWMYLAIKEN